MSQEVTAGNSKNKKENDTRVKKKRSALRKLPNEK
jgi:hypothetical protein